jgi:predicted DNA-binding transcriptional regulator AlpA
MAEQRTAERLLTAKAVGEMLSLSKRQIFRLNSCGRIPRPLRIGGSVRWVNSTIRSWIALGCPDRQSFEAREGAGNE